MFVRIDYTPFRHVNTISSILFFSLFSHLSVTVACVRTCSTRPGSISSIYAWLVCKFRDSFAQRLRIIENRVFRRLAWFSKCICRRRGSTGFAVSSGNSIHSGVLTEICSEKCRAFASVPFRFGHFSHSSRCSIGGNRMKPCVQWITWLHQTIQEIFLVMS